MNSTVTISTTERPHNLLRNIPQSPSARGPAATKQDASAPTSVVYDDTKVCVGGFVLWSFGGHQDDGRLGRILVGGGALL